MWKVPLPIFLLCLAIQQRLLSVTASCVDKVNLSYEGTKVCEYVRSRPEVERQSLCIDIYPRLQEDCPVSCSVCCEDDPRAGAGCAQLDQELCASVPEASFFCPVTCDTCPLPFELECDWRSYGSSIVGEDIYSQSGESISISANGKTLAIGAYGNTPDGNFNIYLAGHVRVFSFVEDLNDWVQKGSDIDGDEECGFVGDSVSLSDDGSIVAFGAPWANNRGGKVEVYRFSIIFGDWRQLGGDIDNEFNGDDFGYSVSLSSDGKIVAAGATDNSDFANDAGHVRVYYYDEESDDWVQMGSDIDGEAAGDSLGVYTSLSSDGKTLSASAFRDNGANVVRVYSFDETDMEWKKVGEDIGNGGDWFGMSTSSAVDIVAVGDLSDVVKVVSYDESSMDWLQMGNDVVAGGSFFGRAISLSGDGMTMAVGAPRENEGSVYVYNYDHASMEWVQIGDRIDGQDSGIGDENFGDTLSISSNGQILAVGAPDHDCSTGRVEVFKYSCSSA